MDPRSHPFLLLGLATLGLWWAIETLGDAVPQWLLSGFRALVVPAYFGRLAFLLVAQVVAPGGLQGLPNWAEVVSLPFVLGPYLVAEWMLRAWRSRSGRSPA